MKAHLTKRYRFSASHRLHNDEFSEEENRATYGKCNNPHGHGHNYALEVTVSGQIDPGTGMVYDLGALDSAVQSAIIDRFGHENLNCVQDFAGIVPTSENLAKKIFEILKRELAAVTLDRVKLDETSQNSFEYTGESEIGH
jgi:6-pyruvoyltetrahydropterin/6-carboxytetrahydropterin synthase